MLRGKRQYSRLYRRNTRLTLCPSQDQTPEPNNSTSQSGRQDVEPRHIYRLVRPFKKLFLKRPSAPPPPSVVQELGITMDPLENVRSNCRATVLTLLPDIDPEYLTGLCEAAQWDSNLVIDRILDQVEDGQPYPTVPKPNLKRKREDEEDVPFPESAAKKFDNDERRSQRKKASYLTTTDALFQQTFPQIYVHDLRKILARYGHCLYPAFLALDKALTDWDERNPPFKKKTRITQPCKKYDVDKLCDLIRDCSDAGEREAMEEFRAAMVVRSDQRAEAAAEMQRERDEIANLETARREGNVCDCGCCFVEYAFNRMVHCDGETLHWFCRDCARMMAETQIGLSRYNLDCMSTDGCTGRFALDQREIFLDASSRTALDRIEQEAVLREAGIENLESCPHCPFAAEYPPIELNKEFRCLNPDCGVISCRSCRKETHVPKSCAEAALEDGHAARHEIEEAMSAALIRKCNKCAAPFIKQDGCNKMTCIKCRNIQCYVCSRSCDYGHFNDSSRGGKLGNCPLFDNNGIEVRHQEEVRTAEEQARKQALEKHPQVQVDLLEFKVSDKVKKDEDARKRPALPRARRPGIHLPHVHLRRMQHPPQPIAPPAPGQARIHRPPVIHDHAQAALAGGWPPQPVAAPPAATRLRARAAALQGHPAHDIQQPIQYLEPPLLDINPQALQLQPPVFRPDRMFHEALPIPPPAPPATSGALAQLADDDHRGRGEPPIASPAGNNQLEVANLPGHSAFHAPQEEAAMNRFHSWVFPPDLARHGGHDDRLNNLHYNDFMGALDDFNRDDFMNILNGLREEEARGFGGAQGNTWGFDA